jgi:type VI secretion system secreted protein Hcp
MFNAFLEIDGMEGESLDDRHRGWVEIFSYSHGITQEVSKDGRSGGGRRAGKSKHDDFVVVKALDKTSPLLALACCNGEHIRRVKLELCRAEGNGQAFMEYRLNDVIVSSVQPCGSAEGEDIRPFEEVSFTYGKIRLTYAELDPETGESKGEVKTSWDVRRNAEG